MGDKGALREVGHCPWHYTCADEAYWDSLRPSIVGKLARALSVDVLDIIEDEEEV